MIPSGPPPIPFTTTFDQNPTRIPFEYSKIMDECRLEVLRKFRKEIIDQVRFSDVSSTLIGCGLFSKDECFEVCKLSVKRQMIQCYQKLHDIIDILVCQQKTAMKEKANEGESKKGSKFEQVHGEDKQTGLVKNIWDNFLLSLKKEHALLATKIENELYKGVESKLVLKRFKHAGKDKESGSLKLKKEDIGKPQHFQHVQHYGLKCTSKIEAESAPGSNNNCAQELDENDSDLKEFFRRAGVMDRHLSNAEMRQIIMNFIANHGGMDAIRREVREEQAKVNNVNITSPPPSLLSLNHEDKANRKQTTGKNDEAKHPSSPTAQGPPPATVPFQPTPKPVPQNLYYF